MAGLALATAHAASRATAALGSGEEAERHLVRVLKEVGVHRALALLPPSLARAVQSIRAVARLVADLSRDR